MTEMCLCYSDRLYLKCCHPFHVGDKKPESSLELMRSRYSGYAKNLADYIMETTHPENVGYSENKEEWSRSIKQFTNSTAYTGLDVLHHLDQGDQGTVTFLAHLEQNGDDISFKEKSEFIKENGIWYYLSGQKYERDASL